jgi:hypothetical protein
LGRKWDPWLEVALKVGLAGGAGNAQKAVEKRMAREEIEEVDHVLGDELGDGELVEIDVPKKERDVGAGVGDRASVAVEHPHKVHNWHLDVREHVADDAEEDPGDQVEDGHANL